MKSYSDIPKGASLIRFFVHYLPEFRGKNYLLLRLAEAINKEWTKHIEYKTPQGLIYDLNLEIIGNRELFFLGKHEADLSWVIENLIENGDIVIEAGIDIGIHTVFMAKKIGIRGYIHGFDPLASAIVDTQHHLKLNGLKNVTLNQLALGEQEGTATIYSFTNLPRAHSSLNDLGKSHTLAHECIVTTIDKYVLDNSMNQLKLIKLDIEGSEMPALRGAIDSISKMHPLVVVEANYETSRAFNYQPEDIKEWFEKLSYACFVFHRGKWFKVKNNEEIRHGDNMLFVWNSDNHSLAQLHYL